MTVATGDTAPSDGVYCPAGAGGGSSDGGSPDGGSPDGGSPDGGSPDGDGHDGHNHGDQRMLDGHASASAPLDLCTEGIPGKIPPGFIATYCCASCKPTDSPTPV